MQFSYFDELTERQYAEILKKIKLRMNGVTAYKMKEMGMIYEKNLGVSVVHIREIAAGYKPSQNLAARLWKNNQRETRILAFILSEPEKTTLETAIRMASEAKQTELAETGAMFLYSKIPAVYDFCVSCINTNISATKMAGFHTATRVYLKLNTEQGKNLIQYALQHALTKDYHVAKSAGLYLSRMCRIDKNTAENIYNELNKLREGKNTHLKIIKDMTKQEIQFFVHK